MVLKAIFGGNPLQDAARALYEAAVAQARRPEFYLHCGLPDSLDGRFEMICLHSYVVLRRLGSLGPEGEALGQAFVDHLARDLDRSLREMGAGDLGVGRRVRTMAEGMFGRISAYERGLAEGAAEMGAALGRNLYGTVQPSAAQLQALSGYVAREAAGLAGQGADAVIAGRLHFGPPPERAAAPAANPVDPSSGLA